MYAKPARQIVAAAMLLSVLPFHGALADMTAATDRPAFSEAEQAVIARNVALSEAVKNNPWVVRQFMDRLEQAPSATKDVGNNPTPPNPDMDRLERASPEAAHDLLQIIKQAGANGGGDLAR